MSVHELEQTKPFEYVNDADPEKIPEALRPVVDDMIQVYQAVYGESLTAVYGEGSVTRGDWRPGSDVDMVGIISTLQTAETKAERERRFDELYEKWKHLGIGYLDGIAIPKEEFDTPSRSKQMIILQTDATCLWGKPEDFSRFVPTSRVEFATAVSAGTSKVLEKSRSQNIDDNEEVYQDVRRAAKFGIRLLDRVAIVHGAVSTHHTDQHLDQIKEYLPAHTELAQRLDELRLKTSYTAEEKAEIENLVEEVIKLAEANGIGPV